MPRRINFGLLCVGVAMMAGCQSAPGTADLPTYPALDGPAAREILVQRATAIHIFSAECELTLTRGNGQTIHLDGLMVMSPPDRLRLRVWKMDQAVFDLTVLPGGLWIETSQEAARHGADVPMTVSAAQLARFLSWFEGGFFSSPGLKILPPSDSLLHFRRDLEDSTSIECEVDRSTATPRNFRLIDAAGETHFTLMMLDYRSISGMIWPVKVNAIAAAGAKTEAETIEIVFRNIEFDGEIGSQAFVPPHDAEKRE